MLKKGLELRGRFTLSCMALPGTSCARAIRPFAIKLAWLACRRCACHTKYTTLSIESLLRLRRYPHLPIGACAEEWYTIIHLFVPNNIFYLSIRQGIALVAIYIKVMSHPMFGHQYAKMSILWATCMVDKGLGWYLLEDFVWLCGVNARLQQLPGRTLSWLPSSYAALRMGSPEIQESETGPDILADSLEIIPFSRKVSTLVRTCWCPIACTCLLHFCDRDMVAWIALVFCAHLDATWCDSDLPGATQRLCATSHHAGSTALLAPSETQWPNSICVALIAWDLDYKLQFLSIRIIRFL